MKENRASETAKLIALATVRLDADPARRGLVAPGAAELSRLFLEEHPLDRWLARAMSTAAGRWFWERVERLSWPGIGEHFWRRKRWLEKRVRERLAAGDGRVLVAGAGFDTLALRLAPEFPAVEFVELDHPATQRLKLRTLRAAGREVPANLRFSSQNLVGGALPAGLCPEDLATTIVAEGLLMYLPEPAVRAFLQSVAALPALQVRLLFSFMNAEYPLDRVVAARLKVRGEPLLWSLQPAGMSAFLESAGLRLIEQVSGEFLASEVGASFRGEDLAVAERR